MRTIELYLHGLKWKDHAISDNEFGAGVVRLFVDRVVEDGYDAVEAVFRIRECAEVFRESMRQLNSKSPNGRDRYSDHPIDRVDIRDSFETGMKDTIYIWYRANCDDPSFCINEQNELAFRQIETNFPQDNFKRHFPDVREESKIKSKPVPQKKLTVFDILDLE